MIALRAWLSQYALLILAAVAAAGWAFGGLQTLRLSNAKEQAAKVQTEQAQIAKAAAELSLQQYKALADSYKSASAELLKVKGERDAALKKTGRKVIEYITRPGADAQCLDDDGLRLITDLGRGAIGADPAGAAGKMSGGSPSTN